MNEAGGREPKFEVVQPLENAESIKAPVEQGQLAPETVSGRPALPLPPVMPDLSVATPVLPVQQDNAIRPSVVSPKTSKLPAADGRLIEKQWVQKAKEIVADTKSDPYKQKTEIAAAKADYIQKRFKKVIKTDNSFDATRGHPEQGRTGDAVTV